MPEFKAIGVNKVVIESLEKKPANERFSEYLLRKGVLSPQILERLQKEFLGEPNRTNPNSVDRTHHSPHQRRKHTTKKNKGKK